MLPFVETHWSYVHVNSPGCRCLQRSQSQKCYDDVADGDVDPGGDEMIWQMIIFMVMARCFPWHLNDGDDNEYQQSFVCFRVAEVVRRHKGPLPKTLD